MINSFLPTAGEVKRKYTLTYDDDDDHTFQLGLEPANCLISTFPRSLFVKSVTYLIDSQISLLAGSTTD